MASKQAAVQRMEQRLGANKRHTTSLNYAEMRWNWQGLIQEARGWQDGQKCNWSAIAQTYGVHEIVN